MKRKALCIVMSLLVMTMVLTACGSSNEEEVVESETAEIIESEETEVIETEDPEIDIDVEEELAFWYGEYTTDNYQTLVVDYSYGYVGYTVSVSGGDSVSSRTSTFETIDQDDLNILEDDVLIFTYNDSDGSIDVTAKSEDYVEYEGTYYFLQEVYHWQDDERLDLEAPESIEDWYGDYAGEMGTLSISDSLDEMVDYTLETTDGSWMSGTWWMSDAGLVAFANTQVYAIYNVEDGSIEIVPIRDTNYERNASYIGIYYPVE